MSFINYVKCFFFFRIIDIYCHHKMQFSKYFNRVNKFHISELFWADYWWINLIDYKLISFYVVVYIVNISFLILSSLYLSLQVYINSPCLSQLSAFGCAQRIEAIVSLPIPCDVCSIEPSISYRNKRQSSSTVCGIRWCFV